jgi:hypothetical protein
MRAEADAERRQPATADERWARALEILLAFGDDDDDAVTGTEKDPA